MSLSIWNPQSLGPKINVLWRVVLFGFLLFGFMTLIGRDHYILGTMLNLCRWLMIAMALSFYLVISRHGDVPQVRTLLLVVIVGASIEYVWNRVNQKGLGGASSGTELKVMSYNVYFKNENFNASLKLITQHRPDILAVQELTPELQSKLESSVSSLYPYRKTISLRGTHGIATYSRYPIRNWKVLNNYNDHPYALMVELEINHKLVQVINVHLASPAVAVENPTRFMSLFRANYELRNQQLNSINTMASENVDAFQAQLLIGDLNTMEWEPVYRRTREEWVNLYDIGGSDFGFSFPNSSKVEPFLRLDYLFGRGKLDVNDVQVLSGGSSDHLAVIGSVII